jgi:spore maturation protein CgeB
MFKEGVEAEFFSPDDPEELVGKVRGLLSDEVRRHDLREAGYVAVSRGAHTYRDRMLRLLQLHEQHGLRKLERRSGP